MVARKYLSQGDLASAKRMALKSKRFQHLPVADALLKQLDDIQNPTSPASPKSTNTSSKHSNSNKRSNHSTRNGAGAGSNSKPQASQRDSGRLGSEESQGEKENVQVRYTASQARIVREVRSEKDYYKLLKIDRSIPTALIRTNYVVLWCCGVVVLWCKSGYLSIGLARGCLLYTSDAADEEDS
eukprot:407161-Amorphochlora_amoeboformis.AAC.2